LDAGANPNVINKGGATPLGLALGNPSMAGTAALSELKKLTTIQVTPKMPGLPCYRHDSKGRTPLHYLVKMEIPSKLEALLQNTSDLICMDNYGETPLHFAAFFGTSEHVSLLLKYGANPNVINKRGETPLGLALGNPSMAGTAALSELKKLTTIEVTDKDPKKIIAKVVAQPKQTCSTSIRLCSTEIVCLLAISKSGNTVFWGTNSYNLIAVAEAKRRGRTCGVKGN
jgi:ankyrin repeat protein